MSDAIDSAPLPDTIRKPAVTSPLPASRMLIVHGLDVFSRKVVGWSIDSLPATTLVTNALGMAIEARRPVGPTVIHSDQGTQFTSWAFTRRAIDSGLLPSMGAVGVCFDCDYREVCCSGRT